ncbi:MAG: manganese transporter [candidate division Zixibacteria bacterium]|nr:manganese transporter [candidate division Zixibacteria bacterium]
MRKIGYVIGLLVVFALALNCGGDKKTDGDLSQREINIVATTGMITDLVENVGGERVSVIGLMGPGVDPHLYKASEGDVSRMANADIIFYNGLHLEGAMAELFEEMQSRKRTVAVTDAIDEVNLLSPSEYEGSHDPHVWFDVSMWMQTISLVRDVFIEVDPEHEETYTSNAEKYQNQLQELHEYVKSRADEVPEQQRVLITAHDAFNYFGRAYGFEVKGLQGISTASEAGTADVRELADFIAKRKIPAVFVESSVPKRNIEAVQAAVKSRGFAVRIGGELFSDAMGSPGTPEGNYIGMVKHNIDTIVGALTQ